MARDNAPAAEERGIVPEGATGYHRISVSIEA